jgi:hypothetical protein
MVDAEEYIELDFTYPETDMSAPTIVGAVTGDF